MSLYKKGGDLHGQWSEVEALSSILYIALGLVCWVRRGVQWNKDRMFLLFPSLCGVNGKKRGG